MRAWEAKQEEQAIDWAKYSLTEELVIVVKKPAPDSRLGITLTSYEDDIEYPRVTGQRSSPPRHPQPMCRPGLTPPLMRTGLKPGGLAAASGELRHTDVVVAVNGQQVAGPGCDQMASRLILASPGDVTLVVRRAPGAAPAQQQQGSYMDLVSPPKAGNRFYEKAKSELGDAAAASPPPAAAPSPPKPATNRFLERARMEVSGAEEPKPSLKPPPEAAPEEEAEEEAEDTRCALEHSRRGTGHRRCDDERSPAWPHTQVPGRAAVRKAGAAREGAGGAAGAGGDARQPRALEQRQGAFARRRTSWQLSLGGPAPATAAPAPASALLW